MANTKANFSKWPPLFCFCASLLTSTTFSQPLIAWEISYGGSEDDYATTIIPVEDGSFLLLLSSYSQDGDFDKNYGERDVWLVKIDEKGQIEWKRNYGGSGLDTAGDIIPAENGYIVIGESKSKDHDLPGNFGYIDVWVFKVDNEGSLLWSKNFGGSSSDYGKSIYQTSDGNYFLSASTLSPDGDIPLNKGEYDAWIIKINGKGDVLWSKTYGGTKSDGLTVRQEFSNGNFLLTGGTYSNDYDIPYNRGDSDAWVVEIDNLGEIIRSNTYGGSGRDYAAYFINLDDSQFLFIGNTKSHDGDILINKGKGDGWVFKTEPSGELNWSKTYGGSEPDGMGEGLSKGENLILVGDSFSEDGDVGENFGNISLPDIWLVEINNSGELIWEKNYGGSKPDDPERMIKAEDGYLLLGFSASYDHDVSKNQGKTDVWLAKLVFPPAKEQESCTFHLYPNPAVISDNLTIEFDVPVPGDLEIEVLNSTGQKIIKKMESSAITTETSLYLPGPIASGFYIVKVSCQEQFFYRKVIIIN